jgi:hypothetical protein
MSEVRRSLGGVVLVSGVYERNWQLELEFSILLAITF